ncbi:restriction endonuclease [Kitasatospora griseola]|uniref:restriction endonuclease n=1 Tax=Kitasatospora griseola TaxID=2064 RepID=UPI0034410A07
MDGIQRTRHRVPRYTEEQLARRRERGHTFGSAARSFWGAAEDAEKALQALNEAWPCTPDDLRLFEARRELARLEWVVARRLAMIGSLPPPLTPDPEQQLDMARRARHRVNESIGAFRDQLRTYERLLTPFDLIDDTEFERVTALLLTRSECSNVRVSGGSRDLGADVIGTLPDGRRVVVQCKRHAPDRPVGSPDVQRFGGTCFVVHQAAIALIVTTSSFTQGAHEYADIAGIGLVDGEGMKRWTLGITPPWQW